MSQLAWPFKLLDREHHKRLVDDMDAVAAAAGVPVAMLDRSMKESGCSDAEVRWVQNYRQQKPGEEGGLLLVGESLNPAPLIRMQAIAAAFIRNFMDARIVTLAKLLPDDDGENDTNPRVLLIPDFFTESITGGKAMTNWQFQYVNGLIMDRFSARRGTVLYVNNLDKLKSTYGALHDLLYGNWKTIEQG